MDSLTQMHLLKLLVCSVSKPDISTAWPCIPLLPFCPSVPLCLPAWRPGYRGAKTLIEAFKDIWVISPPENLSKCSFSPPRLDVFFFLFFLPSSPSLCGAFPSLCLSLHLLCLCIFAVFHGLSLSFYISTALPLLPFPHSSSLFCTSGTPGWLLRADTLKTLASASAASGISISAARTHTHTHTHTRTHTLALTPLSYTCSNI